ncbi:camphor resistance protein CrcB [Prevotella intermedia ATCC 25611 = DSM 20706]|uniref:fluoride efflux transporter CrcB n=1 Tax=Prevotella intermedia TaxID=28131 RepID=UPI000491614E|nr:fluoride efflux transporter CrcB [Prevotella intermedia]APW32985.1 camphor resistance protein CrcB [Prevotella intermedia ATCC 25611 = DSM 20706]SUB98467.1 camphor resistance protein CrcB [Prevotella intermedia]
MFKNIMLVGFGSFFGGVVRYLVTRMLSVMVVSPYPFGTFAVNVLGCFVIGFVSALPIGCLLSPNTRLLLTTGLCGGFTTFSTFMNENATLLKEGMPTTALLYTFASLLVGFLAVIGGQQVARIF